MADCPFSRSCVATGLLVLVTALSASDKIRGVIVDDADAELVGSWSPSAKVAPFYGAGYIFAPAGTTAKVVYNVPVEKPGKYQVLASYNIGGNRSTTALVRIIEADNSRDVRIDQQKTPVGAGIFHDLGEFEFSADKITIEISTEGTAKGVVIADAVRLLTAEEFAIAAREEKKETVKVAAKPVDPPKKEAKPEPPPVETAPAFVRQKPKEARKSLTSAQIDTLLEPHLGKIADGDLTGDGAFLRRLTLDLIGRQPTPDELRAFVADAAADKRAAIVEKLLASEEFGVNWARYWSDVISYRTPQPELTFLNYQPLQDWLAQRFNKGEGWDRISYDLLTATGKVGDNPAATFIGFHQADKSRLAAETTRVFLSTQIQCAECHDHKFIEMPQQTFHHLAAFFVRTEAKLPWNDSNGILVSAKPKGEHRVPGGKADLEPSAFGQRKVELGDSDMARRAALAEWIVSPENPWFAKAFVNRAWARLMGRGFSEPVDEIGELGDGILPELHAAVADHFVAIEFDFRSLIRVITGTKAYQRSVRDTAPDDKRPLATMQAGPLRGDEVFQSLQTSLELPNVTPPAVKPTDAIRFPPPPKSTRDLVNDSFGFDPSSEAATRSRSMQQAMFLMNNRQVQKQVDASPGADTVLAKLLAAETDDTAAVKQLYERILAREPNAREIEIAIRHVQTLGKRGPAFEDLLWSLINSAEFTSRR